MITIDQLLESVDLNFEPEKCAVNELKGAKNE